MDGGLKVDKIFSDGMILQRDRENKIDGYDRPRQKIKISIDYADYITQADQWGYWQVILDKKENSGPFEMLIQGSSIKIIRDLYFGDVFLLAGQSNMELPISRVFDLYEEELTSDFNAIKKPIIRQFTMAKDYAFTDNNEMIHSGQWEELNPNTQLGFSAIGYFFSKHFRSSYKGLNIGLIQTAVGGSPIEAWCNERLISQYRPNLLNELALCRRQDYIKNKIEDEEENIGEWTENLLEKDCFKDHFLGADFLAGMGPNKITIPIKYDQVQGLKGVSGIVWLQKQVDLKANMIWKINKEETYLHLGTIVDADQVWINGIEVGRTSYRYPPRKYRIPRGTLKVGKNIVTIKQFINTGEGEFTPTKPYHIKTKSKDLQISLRGDWSYIIGGTTSPQPPMTFLTRKPTALYHSMICPLKKINIAGILWYQGESNTEDKEDYASLFKEMIQLFREDFRSEDLPFVFVQLANYGPPQIAGAPGIWAKLRQDQEKATLLKKVAMVVSIDQGEAFDIHPVRKKVIGQRLAASMESLIKGGLDDYQGPILDTILKIDGSWILKFKNVGKGLQNLKPIYFSLQCGADKNSLKWLQVKGFIKSKNEIRLETPKGNLKLYKLSYAHLDNPKYVALYNSQGFPCKPFVYPLCNK